MRRAGVERARPAASGTAALEPVRARRARRRGASAPRTPRDSAANSACAPRGRAPGRRVRPIDGPEADTPQDTKAAPMKLLKNLLPLLALALVPALAPALPNVPTPHGLERLAVRETVAERLDGLWRLDLPRTLALPGRALPAAKLEFRREPLIVQLARTADARMAALPIFDGGLVNDGHSVLPYVLVDRGDAIELLVFTPAEGTSFGRAEVLPVHLVATVDGPRLYLGGLNARHAIGVYEPIAAPVVHPPIVVRIERAAPALPAELAPH